MIKGVRLLHPVLNGYVGQPVEHVDMCWAAYKADVRAQRELNIKISAEFIEFIRTFTIFAVLMV